MFIIVRLYTFIISEIYRLWNNHIERKFYKYVQGLFNKIKISYFKYFLEKYQLSKPLLKKPPLEPPKLVNPIIKLCCNYIFQQLLLSYVLYS